MQIIICVMLYIIKEDNFLADYILDALAGRSDVAVVKFERIKYRGVKKYIQFIVRFLRSSVINRKGLWNRWFFPESFLFRLKVIGADDKVLFFSCQNKKELLVLDRELECCSKSVFLWNPLSTVNHNAYSKWQYARSMHRTGMRVCTFDEGDAQAYGFEPVEQVYRNPDLRLTAGCQATDSDVFFVGKDKGRSNVLSGVLAALDMQGVTYDFYILRDKHTKEVSRLKPYYTDDLVPYKDYCLKAMRSRCMLEILQKGQEGMTMRTLEALFFKKKLITDNITIKNYAIYHPDNIYILDGKEGRTIREFLDCGYHCFPPRMTERYDVEHWIERFV